jgi:hypothetical protein
MARMICRTIIKSASPFYCTAIVDYVGISSVFVCRRLTIRMLKSKVDFAASVLTKAFLCLMIRELSIIPHVPVV